MTDKERIARLQEEVMNIQLKYQKELEKYEKDNKELKKQLLLQREKLSGGKVRKIKVQKSSFNEIRKIMV
jgi:optic atrophy protein 1